MAKFGDAISGAGNQFSDALLKLSEDPADEFEAERRFQEFKWGEQQALEQSKHEVEPGQAAGFADRWTTSYLERADAFMDTVPDRLKPKYDERLFDAERELYGSASTFAREEQKRFSIASLDEVKKRLATSGDLDRAKADYDNLLSANPFLSPIDKDKQRRKDMEDIEAGYAEWRISRGDDIDEIIIDLEETGDESGGAPSPTDPRARISFGEKVDKAIDEAAEAEGVDPGLMRVFARIESSGSPRARTGSYKGLFQLSDEEFREHGGAGSIYDAGANAQAAARKIKTETAKFREEYGREPAILDLYMIHQQGEAGYAAHVANSDAPAWENMASTGEGRAKGRRWAKQAIWGNIPSDVRRRFPGGVDTVTSADFLGIWQDKITRFSGDSAPSAEATRVAEAETGTVSDAGVAKLPAKYSYLSAERRAALLKSAKSARDTKLNERRSELKQQLYDDIESVRRTGQGRAVLELETAKKVLEPNQIATYEIDRKEAGMEYEAMRDLPSMTDDGLQVHLDSLAPEPGEADYGLKQKVFDKVERAINGEKGIREQREKDPAAAVDKLPSVQRVKESLANIEDATGEGMAADPALLGDFGATELVLEARMAAQRDIGIPDWQMKPITRAEAEALLNMPSPSSLDEREYQRGVLAAADRAETTYGPRYARAVMEAAIEFQLRNARDRDLRRISSGVILKMARGEDIDPDLYRKMREFQEIDRIGRAFDSSFRPMLDDEAHPYISPEFARETRDGMIDYAEKEGKKTPYPEEIEELRKHPEFWDKFDLRYGRGAAAKALAGKSLDAPKKTPSLKEKK
jgi:Transglycosylase SLT domain.